MSQIHPNLGIAREALLLMEDLMHDLLNRLLRDGKSVCPEQDILPGSGGAAAVGGWAVIRGERTLRGTTQYLVNRQDECAWEWGYAIELCPRYAIVLL